MRKESALSKIEKQVYLNVIMKNLIDFKMGGVVCLKGFKDGIDSYRDGKRELEWMITPEMLC